MKGRMAVTHHVLPGETFASRFVVERTLGEGAMGSVYLAQDLESGDRCALKVMKRSLDEAPKAKERFEREVRAGELIGDAHVVTSYAAGVDETSNLPWLAMEFIEGTPLDDWAAEAPREHRVDVLRQIVATVAHAHRAGVIHRDLKPDNVLIRDEGGAPFVKVLDFGVAKTFRPSLGSSSTEGGLGTPLWTAPEQGKSGQVTPAADVWSLGLLAFFLCAGRVYWKHYHSDEGSMLELAMEMLREPIAAPSQRVAELDGAEPLPPGFDDWFLRAVNRDVGARFADASAAGPPLLEVLDRPPELADAGGPSAPAAPVVAEPGPPTVVPPAPSASRVGAVVAVAVLVLAILVAFVWAR